MTELEIARSAIKRVRNWPEPNDFEKSLKRYELTRLRKKIEDLEKRENQ